MGVISPTSQHLQVLFILRGEKELLLGVMHLPWRQTSKIGQVVHAVGISTYMTLKSDKAGKARGPNPGIYASSADKERRVPLKGNRGKPPRACLQAARSRTLSLQTLVYMTHIKHLEATWNLCCTLNRNAQKQKGSNNTGTENKYLCIPLSDECSSCG